MKHKKFVLTEKEVAGLPKELIDELIHYEKSPKLPMQILSIFEEQGDFAVLSVDRLLINLYKKTGRILKRNEMVSVLYRLRKNGLIFPVGSFKGYYSNREVTEEEIKNIFN